MPDPSGKRSAGSKIFWHRKEVRGIGEWHFIHSRENRGQTEGGYKDVSEYSLGCSRCGMGEVDIDEDRTWREGRKQGL